MSSVQQIAPDRWEIHMGAAENSEVTFEVHMSRDEVQRLMDAETARLASYNHGQAPPFSDSPGVGVLMALVAPLVRGVPNTGTPPPPPSPSPPEARAGFDWKEFGEKLQSWKRWLVPIVGAVNALWNFWNWIMKGRAQNASEEVTSSSI